MARRSRSAIVRTVVARAPSPIIRIAAPHTRAIARRAGRAVRRGAGVAGRAVASEKHTLTAIGAAAVLGFVEKSGVKIPTLGPVGPAGTIGLGAWLYGRMTKNAVAQHVATGLLSVAANRWAATGTIAGDELLGTGVVFDDED